MRRLGRHAGAHPGHHRGYQRQVGGFEIASVQVNFNDLPLADAEASMRLFGEAVLPIVASAGA